MKISLITLLSAFVLVGCGGGGSSSTGPSTITNADDSTAASIVTTESYDLVIDSGRGTSNNQDTEAGKQ